MIKNDKRKHINLLAYIVLGGFTLGVFFHYILGFYFNLPYPYNTFLFNPMDRLNDFFNMYKITENLRPYSDDYFFRSNYFPAANLFFYLFSLINNSTLSLIIFLSFGYVIYLFAFVKNFTLDSKWISLPTILIILLNYPILFTLDRANLELYLFGFVFLFIVNYNSNNLKVKIGVLFLFAVTISMKLYTGVFLILLLKEKKYKDILLILLLVFLLSIISLLFFEGGLVLNIKFLMKGLSDFNTRSSDFIGGVQHNSSLYGFIKIGVFSIATLLRLDSDFVYGVLDLIRYPYLFFVFCLFLYVIYCVIKSKSTWESLYLLTFCLIFFPHVSYDYKLLFLIIPMQQYFKNDKKYNILYTFLFGLLLIPKDFIILSGDVSISSIINPFLLFYLFIHILKENHFYIRKVQMRQTGLEL